MICERQIENFQYYLLLFHGTAQEVLFKTYHIIQHIKRILYALKRFCIIFKQKPTADSC